MYIQNPKTESLTHTPFKKEQQSTIVSQFPVSVNGPMVFPVNTLIQDQAKNNQKNQPGAESGEQRISSIMKSSLNDFLLNEVESSHSSLNPANASQTTPATAISSPSETNRSAVSEPRVSRINLCSSPLMGPNCRTLSSKRKGIFEGLIEQALQHQDHRS